LEQVFLLGLGDLALLPLGVRWIPLLSVHLL
jgi:hypothetical protein